MTHADRIVVLDHNRPATIIQGARSCSTQSVDHKSVLSAQWMLVHVAKGEGWTRGAGYLQPIVPGTLLSLPPGRHDFRLTVDHEFMLLAMREPGAGRQTAAGFSFPLVRRLSRFENKLWLHRLEDAAHAVTTASFVESDAIALRDDLFDLLWLPSQTNNRQAVHDALQTLWKRAAEPLRLGDVAGGLGYTANYLNDLARMHTGRSLGRWLVDMRMSLARSALAHTDGAVADVGASAGYDDPAYFSRAFKRSHGVSPVVWRIAHRPQDPRHALVTMGMDEFKEVEQRLAVVSV